MDSTQQYQEVYQPEAAEYPQGTPAGKVLNEKIISKEIMISKRIIREEIVEDPYLIQERIIEIAKPVQQRKVVEVPEIEYRDKLKEVVQKIYKEKIIEVPKKQVCERIIEKPKIITQEKYREVPMIEYRDVVTEQITEIPEGHAVFTTKQVPVPVYVDDKGQRVERPTIKIERKIPVPVEAVTTYEYLMAEMRPCKTKIQYPVYAPRFISVPVHADEIDTKKAENMKELSESLTKLVGPQAVELHEIEELHKKIESTDYISQIPTKEQAQQMIREKWLTGQLQVSVGPNQTERSR